MRIIHPHLDQDWPSLAGGLARHLRQAGLRPGQVLAVQTADSAMLTLLSQAVPSLGAALLPLDPALPHAASQHLLRHCAVDLLLQDQDISRSHLSAAPLPPNQLKPDDLALIIATSGSTGQPKGVMLTHGAIQAAAAAAARRIALQPDDRWLACLPLFHIGGYSILTRCAQAQATAVIVPRFQADSVHDALHRHAITHLSLVPTMLDALLPLGPPPNSLRHVLVGGAALGADLAAQAIQAGWPLRPTYGMSECASQLATLDHFPADWQPGQVGHPLPGMDIHITKDGRLALRGPSLMLGYANPHRSPGDGLQDGWLISNDLAHRDTDGGLCIVGRSDDMIVSGGKKIHPQTVEDLLAPCPGIGHTLVSGRDDPHWGQIIIVTYTGPASPQDVLTWCTTHLPGSLRPRQAHHRPTLPLTSNGKPDRRALSS